MNNSSDNTYSTNDTSLAAWLVSQGFKLLDLDFSNPISVAFLFPDDTKALKEAVRVFQRLEAVGNVNAFYKAYKQMLLKIRAGRQW